MKKIIAILILLTFFTPAWAGELVGVLSKRKGKEMESLLKTFSKAIKSGGHEIFDIPVEERKDYEIIEDIQKCAYLFCTNSVYVELAKVSDRPGVYCFITDPKKYGLIDSDGYSTSSLQGLSIHVPPGEKFKILKNIMPDGTTFGLVTSVTVPEWYIRDITEAAQKEGFNVLRRDVTGGYEVLGVLQQLKDDIQGILLEMDPLVLNNKTFPNIIKYAMINNLTTVGFSPNMTKAGVTVSLHADYRNMGDQAGKMMLRIIDGSLNSASKIRYVEDINYSINKKAAEKIKLEIPSKTLKKAEKIF